MKLNYFLYILFFFISYNTVSQDMQEGFTYLENGSYKLAENYFENVLIKFPKNKTARICYGRAVGLNGDPKKAETIFVNLLNDYSNDFEVKLNYGESLLWGKKFKVAEEFYKGLVLERPKSFPALLGYANTLSNLMKYADALQYIEKSLFISPNNKNALISKKYIHLGYANDFMQKQDYNQALLLLQKNLIYFVNDVETQLNIANLYISIKAYDEARRTYESIQSEKPFTALNGFALISHLENKNKKALSFSKDAISKLKNNDIDITNQTYERYIQALVWNKKFPKASKMIDSLIQDKPNSNWVLGLSAMLNIYTSKFEKSISNYNSILKNDTTSFDAHLGKANALKALKKYNKSYVWVNKTLELFDNQKDALQFHESLNKQFTPFAETNTSFSSDNGDNEAFTFSTHIHFPLSTKFKITGIYSNRNSKNSTTNNEANANNIMAGFNYLAHPKIKFISLFGITDVNAKTTNYKQFLTDISIHTTPLKLQTLDVGYKKEWQNFNADLLSREIVQNTIYANYNISSNFNFGWYTQYNYSWQNDENQKQLLFTSLYYTFFDKPVLKGGINYQYITFLNQVPTIYFSPKKFNVVEVFVELLKNQKGKYFFDINTAAGFQFIENNKRQVSFRVKGKIGYHFTNRFSASIYGLHSNIASTTAAGFRLSETGFKLRWEFFKKPIFIKKVHAKD